MLFIDNLFHYYKLFITQYNLKLKLLKMKVKLIGTEAPASNFRLKIIDK